MKGSVCFFTIVWWQYIHTENQFKMKNFLAKTKISLISVKTLKWTRLEMWWVGVQDRNLDRPRIPAPLVKIRPYQGWGLRCKVSHPDAICSSCHHAEAREAESWQGEFQHFFFFFSFSETFMWIFLWGGRKPVIFLGCCPFILELIRWPHSLYRRMSRSSTGNQQ